MSVQRKSILSRTLCAYFVTIVVVIFASNSFAQVPTAVPCSKNIAGTETLLPSGHASVVKVMAADAPIPFGIAVCTGNSAVLDMKGNDQEIARRFTFKNLSSGRYTISSIDFEKHDNCFEFLSIESGESFPFEIAPGQTFAVRVAFKAKGRNIPVSNTLNIKTEENKLPISYEIQAIQQPLSAMPWNKKIAVAQAK